MEKRLYLCDCCGDEIKENTSCHRISIEGVTIRKNYWCEYVIDSYKNYQEMLLCDKCYDREKDRSLIIPRYETMYAEWDKKRKEYEEQYSHDKIREVPQNE